MGGMGRREKELLAVTREQKTDGALVLRRSGLAVDVDRDAAVMHEH
jgi:hypothetical protein